MAFCLLDIVKKTKKTDNSTKFNLFSSGNMQQKSDTG